MDLNDITPASLKDNSSLNSSYSCFIGLNTYNKEGFECVACYEHYQANHHEFLQKKLTFCLCNYNFITSNIKRFSVK
jgi:hypothetical protein